MKSLSPNFSKRPEEKVKFNSLIKILVWAKEKTGKSSAEIVNVVLSKGKEEISRSILNGL